MFDSSGNMDEVIDDLIDLNDETPYNADGNYTDAVMKGVCQVGPTLGATQHLSGFAVPFGLLEVITEPPAGDDGSANNITILVEMAAGPYHGVYAERVV
jgi:hypothetical protein